MKVSVYESGVGEHVAYWTDKDAGSFSDRSKIGACIEALKSTIAFLMRNQVNPPNVATFTVNVVDNGAAAVESKQPAEPCTINWVSATPHQIIARTVSEVAEALKRLREAGVIEDEDIHVSIQPIPSKSEPSADCWFSVKIPAKNPKPLDPSGIHVARVMGAPLRRS